MDVVDVVECFHFVVVVVVVGHSVACGTKSLFFPFQHFLSILLLLSINLHFHRLLHPVENKTCLEVNFQIAFRVLWLPVTVNIRKSR